MEQNQEESWEEEPIDLEHDPTLASCCRRELRNNRIMQEKLDTVRSSMPGTLVDKSRISGAVAPQINSAYVDNQPEGYTEDEIDALLAEDEEDELKAIREMRLQEMKEQNQKSKVDTNRQILGGNGVVTEIAPTELLSRVCTRSLAAVLLYAGKLHDSQNQGTAAVLNQHMEELAEECRGTVFLRSAMSGHGADDIRHALMIQSLPAIVCFRAGVVVCRVAGGVRQFVQMGSIGQAVFRAWLHESRVIARTIEECQERINDEVPDQIARQSKSDDESEDSAASDDDAEPRKVDAKPFSRPQAQGKKLVATADFETGGIKKEVQCRDPKCVRKYPHQHISIGAGLEEAPFKLHPHDTH